MNRDEVLQQVVIRAKKKETIQHSLLLEKLMKNIATIFNDNEDKWSILGLLHGIDVDKTIDKPEEHGIEGSRIAALIGCDDHISYSLKAHNPKSGYKMKRKLDKTLYSGDVLVTFYLNYVKTFNNESFKNVSKQDLLQRINDENLISKENKEKILLIELIDISIEQFIEVLLKSVEEIEDRILEKEGYLEIERI